MRLVLKIILRIKNLLWRKHASYFFTKDHFQFQIVNCGWQIGDYTYGRPIVIGGIAAKLQIGKYCSISENCSIILANHNVNHISTYPFLNVSPSGPISPQLIPDLHAISKGDTTIGNDVWIGRNTVILSGISIGDGAVIGAGSVVTKNVPAYAIVVGNPARIAKYRFDSQTIEKFLKLRWWDWNPEYVFQNSIELRQSPEQFLSKYENFLN